MEYILTRVRRTTIGLQITRNFERRLYGEKVPYGSQGNRRIHATLMDLVAQGDAAAQYRLACCYEDGLGVKEDLVTAHKWFQCAAEGGHAPAMFHLGRDLFEGVLGSPNRVRGLYWLLNAVKRGNLDAMEFLAGCYHCDDILPARRDLAVKWYRMAANRGRTHSMVMLGHYYKRGWGVEPNLVKAFVCFNVGRAKGADPFFREMRYDYTSDLTDEQRAEVRSLSESMIKGGPLDL